MIEILHSAGAWILIKKAVRFLLVTVFITLFLAACSPSAPAAKPTQTSQSLSNASVTAALDITPSPAGTNTLAATLTPTAEPIDLSQFHSKWVKALTKAAYFDQKDDALALLSPKNGEELLSRAAKELKDKGLPEGNGLTLDAKQFGADPKGQGGYEYTGRAVWNYKDGKMCSLSTIAYQDGEWSVTDWSWTPCAPASEVTPTNGG